MDKLSYADIISSLALLTATIALVWNIIRDLMIDRTSIKIHIVFGEVGNIKNSATALFAEAGSLKPDHKFDNVGTLVKIINTGRRSVVVCRVGGKLKNGNHISMAVEGLPKLLKPYEEFSNISDVRNSFMDIVKNDEIKKIWAEDTKGEKWMLSKKGLEKLKETANYINAGKHL
jgi:predicted RNA-binding protein with EMAP domain